MSIAFVFPGQGSQHVGMGREVYDRYDTAKRVFEEASDTLGYDMKSLCFEGPKSELNKTFRTQPAILTVSTAFLRVIEDAGLSPTVVAGHSLGEYSALVSAGVISFPDALKLTEKRGHLMQNAVPEGKGLMAAILGLSREEVDGICLEVSAGYVSPANYNCPGQIVIAGEKEAVEEAIQIAKERGARRAVPLAVSAPSHCALMIEASKKLAEELENIPFMAPSIPVVNNADAIFLNTTGSIKASLVKQLDSPLLWEDSVRNIIESGIRTFVEIGPGRVLSGLIKRIDSSVRILDTETSLEEIMNLA